MKLELFIAGRPISVNSAYAVRARGHGAKRLYMRPAAVAWKQTVEMEVRQAIWHQFKASQVEWKKPISISYEFQGCAGDADNRIKLVCDSISRAIGIDDRHFSIGKATISRSGQPGVYITIQDAEEDAA